MFAETNDFSWVLFGGTSGSVHWTWAQNIIYYKKPERIVLLEQI